MKGDYRKIRSLSPAEFLILAQAAVLLPAVKLAQRWTRLDRLHNRLNKTIGTGFRSPDRRSKNISADDVARLVGVAARRGLVRTSCLQHALVLWTLLKRHGFDAAIRFGVRKNEAALEAHAWVELDGRVLNDSADIREQYPPFQHPVVSGQEKLP